MFKNNNNMVGLDIGTSSIKVLVVSRQSEGSELEVLSQVTAPSSGVRKGVVVKPLQVAEEIRLAIEEAEVSAGQKINSVYSSINGSHLTAVFSKGVIAVSRADREISQEDIDRAIQNAQTISLPANKEI
ncbi:MAG TPA: cell division protein FtsA, partial [bacterium]|nr:cell division protein FtsA [bacterium]